MANHSQIFKRSNNDITKDKVVKIIKKLNNDMFNDLLNVVEADNFVGIEIDSHSDGFQCWIEEDLNLYESFSEEENEESETTTVKGIYLDIRHGHGTDFFWWLDFLIMYTIANTLHAEISGEGFYDSDGKLEQYPDGYATKTFKEFLDNKYRSMDENPGLCKKLFYIGLKKNAIKGELEFIKRAFGNDMHALVKSWIKT